MLYSPPSTYSPYARPGASPYRGQAPGRQFVAARSQYPMNPPAVRPKSGAPYQDKEPDYTMPGVAGEAEVNRLLDTPVTLLQRCNRLYTKLHHRLFNSANFGNLRMPDGNILVVNLIPYTPQVAALRDSTGKILGAVTGDGRLILKDEKRPLDLLANTRLTLTSIDLLDLRAFHRNIIRQLRAKGAAADMAPLFKQVFHQRLGLDGTGVTIGTIDFSREHNRQVQAIIKGRRHGLAPGAKVVTLDVAKRGSSLSPELDFEHPQGFKTYLEEFIELMPSTEAKRIQQQIDRAKAGKSYCRVLNMSLGLDYMTTYKHLDVLFHQNIKSLSKMLAKGQIADPVLQRLIGIYQNEESPIKRFQAVVDFTDAALSESVSLKRQMLRYQQLLQEAADAGIVFIVASGNSQHAAPMGVKIKPTSLVSLFVRSANVIHVAGSNTGRQIGTTADDVPAHFSNRGAGKMKDQLGQVWNPTLAAPADWMPFDTRLMRIFPYTGYGYGTSLAAPMVASVVALMLQANPSLTPRQVKQILVRSCENPQGFSKAAVGAGFLNPFLAVQQALQARNQSRQTA